MRGFCKPRIFEKAPSPPVREEDSWSIGSLRLIESEDDDELLFLLPSKQLPMCKGRFDRGRGGNRRHLENEVTLHERLIRSQGLWCMPTVDRREAEQLLALAEPGNFILRVNRKNNAMVLSRRILKETSEDASTNSTRRGYSVRHNLIQVIPRSGYCLTGDVNAHLVFGSIVELLHFYIRLPCRKRPFLRLPRAVLEAQTLQELEQLNRRGIDFWSDQFNERPVNLHTPVRDESHTRNHREPPIKPVKRTRERPNSMDRWSDRSAELLTPQPENSRSRARIGTPHKLAVALRHRASSLTSNQTNRITNDEGASVYPRDNSESDVIKARVSGLLDRFKVIPHGNGTAGKPSIVRTSCSSSKWTEVNLPTSKVRHGVYESEESCLWQLLAEEATNSRTTDTSQTPGNVIATITKSSTNSQPLQKRSSNPPPSSTYRFDVTRRSQDLPSRPVLGLLSRTLDEHLKSIDRTDSNPHNGSSLVNRDKAPCTPPQAVLRRRHSQKTTSTMATAASNVDSIYTDRLKRKTTRDIYPDTTVRCGQTDGRTVRAVDGTGSEESSSDRLTDPEPVELPATTSIGRVFIMEAATRRSDDYNPFQARAVHGAAKSRKSKSRSPNNKPESNRAHQATSKSVVIESATVEPTLRQRQSECLGRKSAIGQGVAASNLADVGSRRHALYLNTDEEFEASLMANRPGKIPVAMFDGQESIDQSQKFQTTSQSATVLTSKKTEFPPQSMSHTCGKDPVPPVSQFSENEERRITSLIASLERSKDKTSPTITSNHTASSGDEKRNGPERQNSFSGRSRSHQLPLHTSNGVVNPEPPTSEVSRPQQSFHPRVSTSQPIPRTRRRTAQSIQHSESIPSSRPPCDSFIQQSPSGSSRASTVFCTPWDAAPVAGMYLSDLIRLGADRPSPTPIVEGKKESGGNRQLRRTSSNLEASSYRPRISKADGDGSISSMVEEDHQRMIWAWMLEHGSEDHYDEAGVSCAHKPTPPPIPQRRVRVKRSRQNQMKSPHLPSGDNKSEIISPYAVSLCGQSRTSISKIPPQPPISSNLDLVGKMNLEQASCDTDLFDIYDEAFDGPDDDGALNLVPHQAATAPMAQDTGVWPGQQEGYVYAKVVPKYLRQSRLPAEAVNQDSGFSDPPQSHVNHLPSSGSLGRKATQHLLAYSCSASSSLATSHSRSSSDCSPTGSRDHGVDKPSMGPDPSHQRPGHHIRKYVHQLVCNQTNPVAEQIHLFLECTLNGTDRGPYRTMQSIRQFIGGMTNYLLRNPAIGLPEAVELEKQELSDFGFVNLGSLLEATLQRYVLRPLYGYVMNQLGREQMKHGEALDPLRTMTNLAQTSIDGYPPEEFEIPLQQRLPDQKTVDRIRQLFKRMESTHSIRRKMTILKEMFKLIRDEVEPKNMMPHPYRQQLPSHSLDHHPIFAWTFARAGLLLTPWTTTTSGQSPQLNDPSGHFVCPIALQADYLDGLATQSQLTCHSAGKLVLNDLYTTLYYMWTLPTRTSSCAVSLAAPPADFSTLGSQNAVDRHEQIGIVHQFETLSLSRGKFPFNSQIRQPPLSPVNNETCVTNTLVQNKPSGTASGLSRRRMLNHRRSKTLQVPTGLSSSSESTEANPPPSISLRRQGSLLGRPAKSSIRSLDIETGHPPSSPYLDTSSKNDYCPTQSTRWRPWIPSSQSSSSQNGVTASIDQPMIRILVMDEAENQLRSQLFPLRPSLTAAELCNMLAFRMKLCDPEEFGLFAYSNGNDTPVAGHVHLSDFGDTPTMSPDGVFTSNPLNTRETAASPPLTSTTPNTPTPLQRTSSMMHATKDSPGSHRSTTKTSISSAFHGSWWLLCKRNMSSNDLIGEPEVVNNGRIGMRVPDNRQSTQIGSQKPVLIYRKITGFYVISDRVLSQAALESSPILP